MPRRSNIKPSAHPVSGESMGYPRIEKLIDTEDFAEINDVFEAAYMELYEVARHKKSIKKSKDAKKIMKSMELVMDLFRELLSIKYQLQEMNADKAEEQ
jgi:hypothetical protein